MAKRLPDFLIIGAQKAGTTSLYRYLEAHPCVLPAARKEVHFFDLNFHKGLSWYQSQFASHSGPLFSFFKKHVITGEASPYYIFHPRTPQRVHSLLPNLKIIVLLRNPVDRAYSHYQHNVRHEREPLSFEDAVKCEAERLHGEVEKMLHDEAYYSHNHQHYSYLARGRYQEQLEAWLRHFPRAQCLCLRFNDLESRPAQVWSEVLSFLNLPAKPLKAALRHNAHSYQPMHPATRRRLLDYFQPHNQKLAEFLGRPLGWDQ